METTYGRQTHHAHPRFRAVGLPAAALVGLNVALMYVVALTPLAGLNDVLFAAPIVGLLVYGAALTGGSWIAERGLEGGSLAMAIGGTALLQGAYALFGGGVLAAIAPGLRTLALGVAFGLTVAMTVVVAGYVYVRDREFDHWSTWSLVAFLVGVGFVAVGTFVPVVLVGGFVFIFLGFTLRLGYEIWRVRVGYDPNRPLVHALGIYVAFTGVFVHVLMLVRQFFVNR